MTSTILPQLTNPSFRTAIPKPIAIVLVVAACLATNPAKAVATQGSEIDTLEIVRHAKTLAADSFRGRATGTPESDSAARYIAAACSDIGLVPIHDSFLMPVPLKRIRINRETVLSVSIRGNNTVFRHGRDFALNFPTSSTLGEFDGRAVLVGTDEEIRASETRIDGAIAVTLGTVSLQASIRLAERGAIAMIHLVANPNAYSNLLTNRGATRVVAADPAMESSLAPNILSIITSPAVSGQIYTELTRATSTSVQLRLDIEENQFESYNVACKLPASTRETGNRVITFTAHYDHLGVVVNGTGADSIYNGFSDNAAGVGMLLGIARHVADAPVTFASDLLFLFFTAEEIGLIGSDHFVANPPFALEAISAVINLDAGAPPAPPWSWRIAGGDASVLGELAVDVALEHGWSATTSSAVPNSDYYPFWRKGVQSIFVVPGVETFEGMSADSTRALRALWDRYHQAADEWKPGFPLAGLKRYAEYALLIALRADEALTQPY